MQILSIVVSLVSDRAVSSSTMLLPTMVAFRYPLARWRGPDLNSFFIALLLGALLWFPNRHPEDDLQIRRGFLIVGAVLGWCWAAWGPSPLIAPATLGKCPVSKTFFESFSA